MYIFKVKGMTCGSCARSITNALKMLDAKSAVTVNLSEQIVSVKSEKDITIVSTLLNDIGFPVLESKNLNEQE